MARLVGPDESSRTVYLRNGLIKAQGRQVTLYANADKTVLADVRWLDGSIIPGSVVTVDEFSKIPLFQFPDGVDVIYAASGDGPVVPIYARTDDRLDALQATVGTLEDSTPVSVKDFGATGDGTTDDTAAVQAAINSVFGASVPALQLHMPAGTYRITNTVNIYQRAISLIGAGVGTTSQFAPVSNPSESTTIKWDGPAGVPMIKIRDSRDVVISDIYFQGHDTNVPSAGLYLEGVAGDALGTNQFMRFYRLKFGFNSWRTGGYMMDKCVHVGGPQDANNDQYSFYDCEFARPVTAGVQIDNSQSIWGAFYNCFFNGNSTAKGLVTTAGTSLYNCAFNACSIDLELNGAPKVAVYGFYSEGSGKLIQVNGRAKLMVKGGQATTHFASGDTYIEHANCVGDASLELESVFILQNLNPHTKKLRVRGLPGFGMGMVRISNCHIPPEDYDIVAPTGTSGFVVAVDDSYSGFNAATPRGIFDRTIITGGATYVPSNLVPQLTGDGSPEGVITAPIGSMYRRKNGTVGSVLYVKESGTGNTGWTAMKVLASGVPVEVSGVTGAPSPSRFVGGTVAGAPTTGTFQANDYVISVDGNVYICTVGGSPGTWVSVGTPATLTALAADQPTVGEIVPRRDKIASTSVTISSGTLALNYFTADKTETINTLTAFTGATAAGATPTLCRMGVYSVDGSGNLTLIASTPNDTALFAVTHTPYAKALSAPWSKVVGQRYAVGVLIVSAAAMPTFHGQQLAATSVISSMIRVAPAIAGRVSGQTDLPASILVGSLTGPQALPVIQMS